MAICARTCRSAAACRRAPRSKSPSCAGCATLFDADAGRCARWRSWDSGPRTTSSVRRSASWTRWRRAWRSRAHRALLDTRTLAVRAGARCRPARELVVINSGVAHNHAAGDYRTRRAECERAAGVARRAAAARPGGHRPRSRRCRCPIPINRRARHVVTENQRVLDCRRRDAPRRRSSGSADCSTHRTPRSATTSRCRCPRSICWCGWPRPSPPCLGARLTGGGFGGSDRGCWCAPRRASGVADRVIADYAAEARSDRVDDVLVPQPPRTDRRHGGIRHETHKSRRISDESFRRVFVLPSLPMPGPMPGGDQPELLPAGFASGRALALVRKPHRGRARAGAVAGPRAIWGGRLTERPTTPTAGSRPSDRLPRRSRAATRRGPSCSTRACAPHSSARRRPALHAPGRIARVTPSPAATSSSRRRPPRARRSATTRRS